MTPQKSNGSSNFTHFIFHKRQKGKGTIQPSLVLTLVS